MITSISIENFKGIGQRVTIPLKPITLLFGPNSAGKSTILQAIQYAADVLDRGNLDADRTATSADIVDLGGFRNFVHGRRADRTIRLGFEIALGKTSRLEAISVVGKDDPDAEAHVGARRVANVFLTAARKCRVELGIVWSTLLGTAYVSDYSVEIDGIPVARIEHDPGRRSTEITSINFDHPLACRWDWSTGKEDAWPWGWPDFSQEAGMVEFVEGEANLEAERREYIEKMRRLQDEFRSTLRYWYSGIGGCDSDEIPANLRLPVSNLKSALPLPATSLRIDLAPSDPGSVSLPKDDAEVAAAEPDSELILEEIFTQVLVAPCDLLRRLLSTITYLGPLREKPGREYQSPRYFDPNRWPNGLAAWDWLVHAPDHQIETVNSWLSDEGPLAIGYRLVRQRVYQLDSASPLAAAIESGRVFDEIDDLPAEVRKLPCITRIKLVDLASALLVEPSEVGEGIAQIVPVVVAMLADDIRTLLVEQPELHVHPRVQVGLGDLIIARLHSKARDVGNGVSTEAIPTRMTIVETHSEHLLLRLLRRIRETSEKTLPAISLPLGSEDLAVTYVEPGSDGARIKQLRINDSGEFVDEWPQGFFEERGEELFG